MNKESLIGFPMEFVRQSDLVLLLESSEVIYWDLSVEKDWAMILELGKMLSEE